MKKQKIVNPKISIIVPVYNVEKYLDKCVQSIVSQTYKNLEIILVDDGSPDNCPKMCDEWAKKDKRIKVIHKKNGGLSDARNSGLDKATGKYIGFVDSDDYIHKDMYKKLLNTIQKQKADVAMCGVNYAYDASVLELEEVNLKKAKTKDIYKYLIVNGKKRKDNKIFTDNIMCAVWRCLYSKEFIKDLRFEKDLFCEDVVFTLELLKKNPKINITCGKYYFYYQRQGSIIHNYNENKFNARKNFIMRSIELLEEKLTRKQLSYYKFLQYGLCFNEVVQSKNKKLRKIFLKDTYIQALNSKENYLEKKQNTKIFKYKIADFLIHKKWFMIYSKLAKLAR